MDGLIDHGFLRACYESRRRPALKKTGRIGRYGWQAFQYALLATPVVVAAGRLIIDSPSCFGLRGTDPCSRENLQKREKGERRGSLPQMSGDNEQTGQPPEWRSGSCRNVVFHKI
jgi:hypothetical protein